MSQTLSPSFARCYYRSLKETPPNTSARRPGPVGACSDAELADHIRQHIAASRLHGEGYRKLWARLRFAGVRASPRRVRRVMRANGLLAPHRVGRTEAKPHDGTIITGKVNEMWGTDMTLGTRRFEKVAQIELLDGDLDIVVEVVPEADRRVGLVDVVGDVVDPARCLALDIRVVEPLQTDHLAGLVFRANVEGQCT